MVIYQVCMEVSGTSQPKDPGFLTGQGPSLFLPAVCHIALCLAEVEWSPSQAVLFTAGSLSLDKRRWA